MSDDKNAALNMAMLAGGMYGPNPYSQFPNGIQGTSYAGVPTDAHGNPIQTPPGMTLNSTPAAAPPPTPMQQPAQQPFRHATMSDGMPYGQTNLGRGVIGQSWDPGQPQQQQQQAAPAAAPQTPAVGGGGNNYQTALAMLANPGHVSTPGANVPATQPITNQPSVLDQFLASQSGNAGEGANGYSNAGFFNTLNKLRGSLVPTPGAQQ